MHSNKYKDIVFIKIALVMAIIISSLLSSCSEKKEKVDSKDLLPEKDLITILTEIHITDGLLSLPQIHSLYVENDSILNYIHVIQKHGYTKEVMDRTMRYYFVKNPKKLIKIYDKVLGKLSKMQSLLEKESMSVIIQRENLWENNPVVSIPDLSGSDTLKFDQNLWKPGIYTLTFTLTLFPDDQSLNPRFTAFLCHPDSIYTGQRDYYPSVDLFKDGRPHVYTFSKIPGSKSHTHMRGWFIECDNNFLEISRHVTVEKISLTCIPSVQ
jgi:hypothetical protein